MANYTTVLLQPQLQLYTHNASAASAFTSYPGIIKVTTVDPLNPNSVRSWTPDLPPAFTLPWLTSFTPGSAYLVSLSANANVVQQGTYPGITVRRITGPFTFFSMPANSLPINIVTATAVNSVGATVPLSSVIGTVLSVVNNNSEPAYPAFNSWKSFQRTLVGQAPEFTKGLFTTFTPNSSYYISLDAGVTFTFNIPRRNGYLITNDARFITTNDGRFLVVNQST